MRGTVRGITIAVICFVVIIALALGTFLVLGLTGVLNPFGWFNGSANLELANRQVFTADEFNKLSVEYSSEGITILESMDGTIVLEEYMQNWEENMLAEISQSGDGISIKHGYRPNGLSIFNGFRAQIKLYLPKEWLGDVHINTSSGGIHSDDSFSINSLFARTNSGGIRLSEITAEGDINLETSSGGVSAESLIAGGDMALATNSGGITIDGAAAQNINATASSGGIRFGEATANTIDCKNNSGTITFEELNGRYELENTSGGIRIEGGINYGNAKTSSGGITAETDQMIGNISLSNTSGGCKLYVPRGSEFDFRGETNSGDVRAPEDDATFYNERDDEEVTATFGSNPQYSVVMTASSGGVRLEWK